MKLPKPAKTKAVSKQARSKMSAAMRKVWARRKALSAQAALAPVKVEGASIAFDTVPRSRVFELEDRLALYERIIRKLVD